MLQVPLYFIAQILGSFLASGTLYLLFNIDDNSYFGTRPAGAHVQSLVFELITTFLLMFVVSAVSTDNRAVSIYALISNHSIPITFVEIELLLHCSFFHFFFLLQ